MVQDGATWCNMVGDDLGMTWALLWQNLARLWHTLAYSAILCYTLEEQLLLLLWSTRDPYNTGPCMTCSCCSSLPFHVWCMCKWEIYIYKQELTCWIGFIILLNFCPSVWVCGNQKEFVELKIYNWKASPNLETQGICTNITIAK